jgi:Zn-dependent protease
MARRFKLFRIFAIDITLDASWIPCAALIGWSLARGVFPDVSPGLPPALYVWMAIAGTLGLFAAIILHELAHSLVARHFGIAIHTITLFIFGGVAQLEDEPRTARSELLVAIAGPAASLALAALAFLGETAAIAAEAPDAAVRVLWYLAFVNTALALFNLIPAFPLDGGRVLRAALWAWRGDLMWATLIAAAAGSTFGIFLMIVGGLDMVSGNLVGGAWRLLIGLFLRGAAQSSREEMVTRALTAGVPVSAAMNRSPIAVPPALSVAALIEDFIYRFPHRCFPVTDQGHLLGTISLDRISLIDPEERAETWIYDVMIPIAAQDLAAPGSDLLAESRRMKREGRQRLWIVQDGMLVGILSLHDLRQYLLTHVALKGFPSSLRSRTAQRG